MWTQLRSWDFRHLEKIYVVNADGISLTRNRVIFLPDHSQVLPWQSFWKASQPSAGTASPNKPTLINTGKIKTITLASILAEILFQNKSLQHYVITSNKKYNITQYFYEYLKKIQIHPPSRRPHRKTFSKTNARNNIHEMIPEPAIVIIPDLNTEFP